MPVIEDTPEYQVIRNTSPAGYTTTIVPKPGTATEALFKAEANRETLQARAVTALATNDTFLAVASPSNAQVIAQVKALTRETSAVIRLLINQLDSTSGT